MIRIERVIYEEKAILRHLMELCQYDMSEFEQSDVNAHGLFDYKHLDHYWTEAGRYPLFIRVDERLAGFVLVRYINDVSQICEFFVMRKYRRHGVGRAAACMVFDHFHGAWQVEQESNNLLAQAFWRNVITTYTDGDFTESMVHVNEQSTGTAQRFKSRVVSD